MNITTYKSIMQSNPALKAMSPHARANALHITVRTLQRIENPNWKPLDEYAHDLERENSRLKKIIDLAIDTPKNKAVSYVQNLDNYTEAEQNAPEEGTSMAYKRMRYPADRDENGNFITKQVSGKNDCECILAAVDQMFGCGFLQKERPGFFALPTAAQPPVMEKQVTPGYNEVVAAWAIFSESRREEGSKSPYKSYMKHSLEYFGNMPIGDIRVRDVQEFLNSRVDKDEELLAKRTIRNIKNIVEQVFDYALAEGYVSTNPARNKMLYNPSDEEEKRIALSKEELLEVIRAIPTLKTENERLYMIMLTGLPYRRGEALGQRWEDIDFERSAASVTGTVAVISGKAKYRKKAKNKQSIRTMVAPEYFMEALKPYRKAEGFLVNNAGEHLTANEIAQIWESIKQQIPLINEKGLTPYNFRHTSATIMYHETKDLMFIAAQMGHSDASKIDAKVYIHDDMESRRKNVKRVEKGMGMSI